MGVEGSLWRAVAVLRWLSLPYAAILVVANDSHYARPLAAWAALAFMAAWTVVVTTWRPRSRRMRVADLAVCAVLLSMTRFVETADRLETAPTLTVTWSAAPVVAWAIGWGWAGGVSAGTVLGVTTVLTKGRLDQSTGGSLVLLVLTGAVVGYVTRLALDAQARLAEATALRGATTERERLARQIHDGVLQALALINRRGAALGGEAASLAAIAAEQEAALRELVARPQSRPPTGMADVREAVESATRAAAVPVEVATPNAPVLLPAAVAAEVAAVVAAALDNVAKHAGDGARAWVLVEDEDEAVTVSVRDDGPGFDVARLGSAAAAGRLGVAQSIRGRAEALGGQARIDSGPGGTEVEVRVPRQV